MRDDLPDKVLLVSHVGVNMYLFRRALIEMLLNAGVEVTVCVPEDEYTKPLRKLGAQVEIYPVHRGLDPIRAFETIGALKSIIKNRKPDLVHSFTHQPNLLTRFAVPKGTMLINSVTGLGSYFLNKESTARRVFHFLYRLTASKCKAIIFQNQDDLTYFKTHRLLKKCTPHVVRGTGVDVDSFTPDQLSPEERKAARTVFGFTDEDIVVTMAARLIRDKGIFEFLQAAEEIAAEAKNTKFLIVGDADPGNPNSLSNTRLEELKAHPAVKLAGWRDDMPHIWALSDIAVLPSYREGLPVSLQEAAASGLPIVTSEAPGCREIVKHGKNGYLVPVQDAHALAVAIRRITDDEKMRIEMGEASRQKAESEFDAHFLAQQIAQVYWNVHNFSQKK